VKCLCRSPAVAIETCIPGAVPLNVNAFWAGLRQMPGQRILLVEDDPDVARILEHVLFDEGL